MKPKTLFALSVCLYVLLIIVIERVAVVILIEYAHERMINEIRNDLTNLLLKLILRLMSMAMKKQLRTGTMS